MTYAEAQEQGIIVNDEAEEAYSLKDADKDGVVVDEDAYNKALQQKRDEELKLTKEVKDKELEASIVQPDDVTATRGFEQKYNPAIMDGIISDGTISPKEQDDNVDAQKPTLFGKEGETYENPTNEKYTNLVGNARDKIISGGLKGVYKLMGAGAYTLTNPFSHDKASEVKNWFDNAGKEVSGKTLNLLDANEVNTPKYKNKHNPEEVTKAFREAGILDADAWQELGNYIGTTGVQSTPDMLAMSNPYTLPAYTVSRIYNSAEERAIKDGRKEPTELDMLKVAPTEIASIMLDTYSLHATTDKVFNRVAESYASGGLKKAGKTIVKEMKNGTIREGTTEAMQNPIELYGQEYGTKHGLSDMNEYVSQAFWGGVAGAGMGGTLGGGSATLAEAQKQTKEQIVANQLDSNIENTDINYDIPLFTGTNRGEVSTQPSTETIQRVKTQLPVGTTDNDILDIATRVEKELETEKNYETETGNKLPDGVKHITKLTDKELEDKINRNQEIVDSDMDSGFSEHFLENLLDEKKRRENIKVDNEYVVDTQKTSSEVGQKEDKKTFSDRTKEIADEAIADNSFLNPSSNKKLMDLIKEAGEDSDIATDILKSYTDKLAVGREELAKEVFDSGEFVDDYLSSISDSDLKAKIDNTTDEKTRNTFIKELENRNISEDKTIVDMDQFDFGHKIVKNGKEYTLKGKGDTVSHFVGADGKSEYIPNEDIESLSVAKKRMNKKESKPDGVDTARLNELREIPTDELTQDEEWELEDLEEEYKQIKELGNDETTQDEKDIISEVESKATPNGYKIQDANELDVVKNYDFTNGDDLLKNKDILDSQFNGRLYDIADTLGITVKELSNNAKFTHTGAGKNVVGAEYYGVRDNLQDIDTIVNDIRKKIGASNERDGQSSNSTSSEVSGQEDGNKELGEIQEDGNTRKREDERSEEDFTEIKVINEQGSNSKSSNDSNKKKYHKIKSDGYSSKNIQHEIPIVEISKFIKKDLAKMAKDMIELTGLKAESKNGKPLAFSGVTTNIPPAGGEARFTLENEDGSYKARFDFPYNPDYTQELGYTDYKVYNTLSVSILDKDNNKVGNTIFYGLNDYYDKNTYDAEELASEVKKEIDNADANKEWQEKRDRELQAVRDEIADKKTAKDKPFGELDLDNIKVAKFGEGKAEKVASQVGEWITLPPFAGSEHGKYGLITGKFDDGRDTIEVKVSKGTDDGVMNVVSYSVGTATTTSKADEVKVKRWLKRFGYVDNTQQVHTNDTLDTQKDDIIEETKGDKDETSNTTNVRTDDTGTTGTNGGIQETGEEGKSSGVRDNEETSNDAGVRLPTEASGESDSTRSERGTRDSDTSSYSGDVEQAPYIINNEAIASSGEVARFNANIEAIKLLKQNKKHYTMKEKEAISRYTGWGGLQKAFRNADNSFAKNWEDRTKELETIFSSSELDSARRGLLDAFYTPANIVTAIWKINKRLGFSGGAVIEPSVGTGRFIGLLPNDLKNTTRFDGIELDPTTSKIASILYPASNIRNSGFEKTNYKSTHELVVGNPPYGEFKLFDANNKKYNKLSAHNYFVVKSLDALKEGGVLNFVISSSFMDNMNKTTKDMINSKAKLIGAIRLPDVAFKDAGTKVTTDIVVFQKLSDGENGNLEEWGEITKLNDLKINKYFVDNPNMLLGTWEKGYRGGGKATAKMADLDELLNSAILSMPENVMSEYVKTSSATKLDADSTIPPSIIYTKDGKVYVNTKDGEKTTPEALNMKEDKADSLIAIRDTLMPLIDMQLDRNIDTKTVEKQRKKLNDAYDSFVKNYGYLNKTSNRSLIVRDRNGYTLLGLEKEYQKTITEKTAKKNGVEARVESAKKADILLERTANPVVKRKADTASEALTISLNEEGIVDIDYIAKLVNRSKAEVEKELAGEIFYDNDVGYVTRDVYLSGDVKTKYESTDNEDYKKELLKVIPKDKKASEISPEIGQSWIDAKYINQYAKEKLGYNNPRVLQSSSTKKWFVHKDSWSFDFPFVMSGYDNNKILVSALNNKRIVIRKKGLDGKTYLDEGSTALVNAKVDELKDDFATWVFSDNKRKDDLVTKYNELFNRYAKADSSKAESNYKIPNIKKFKPREHQTRAVYKSVFGNTPILLNHAVGSGKTLTSQMIAMEWRRLGKAKKPVIVTLKATVPQYAKEFKEAYPNAKLLVPAENDFTKDRRKALLSSIATGDYDAIVLSHQQLGMLENPQEFSKQLMEKELNEAREAYIELKEESGDRASLRDLELKIEKLENKFNKLKDKQVDDILSFDKLGIDGLIIDESHFFKKLAYNSSLGQIKGMPSQEGSKMAFDLYVKTQSLLAKNNNNIVFMTGTPITNTIPELFLVQKFLQNDLLEEQGLSHFDSWAKNYVEQTTEIEMTPTGSFKEVTRIKNFTNLDMLMNTTKQFIDTATNEDIKKSDKNFNLPALKDGKPTTIFIEPTKEQLEYTESLTVRLDTTVKDKEDPDNFLVVFNDAGKMAIDMRLISDSYKDTPDSKLSIVSNRVYDKYLEFKKDKGTQLIFSDIGTPKGGGKAKAEVEFLMQKADSGDLSAQKALEENYTSAELEDILEGGDFSVYEDIRSKLIKKGIPPKEIAFIHDYNSKEQKEELSKKVNSGEIRIVIGSTKKLGTGVNVQERIVAVHHVDIPYTPAELEQRNGRIIRQGNKLLAKYGKDFNIDISYYATKRTLDGVKWQILENKAKFIQQFMSGKYDANLDIEEESNTELMERMKAEASGNPLLLEKTKAQKDIKKFGAMKRSFDLGKLDAKDSLQNEEYFLSTVDEDIANLKYDLEQFKSNPIKIGKKTFEKPTDMGNEVVSLLEKYQKANGLKPKVIGSVGETEIAISFKYSTNEAIVSFNGKTEEDITIDALKLGATGLATRMNNVGNRYETNIKNNEHNKPIAEQNVAKYKSILDKTFNKDKELQEAQEKLDDILQKIAEEAKDKPQEKVTETEADAVNYNKNTSVEQKEKRKKGFDGTEYSDVPLAEDEAMPNNPPYIMELEDIDDSSILDGYKIDRDKGTYELDGKRVQYPVPKNPMGVAYIRNKIEDIIGYKPYRARISTKGVSGLYRKANGELRTRQYSDLETIAHELGHFLYHANELEDLTKDFREELREFSYNKEEETLLSEGYAEFVRAYFTNSSWAKKYAPKFYNAFDEKMSGNKELYKQIKNMQRYFHHYYAQGFDARFNGQMAIYPYSETWKERVINKYNWSTNISADSFKLDFFDRTHGFYVVENILSGDTGMYINKASPTALLRTALGGATSTYEQVITNGIVQKDGDGFVFKKGGKSLQQVFAEPLATGKMAEWTEYALALNARQLKEQNKRSGFNAGDIDKKIELLEEEYPFLKESFEDYQEFQDSMLDFYVDMSYITKQSAENFREANPIYVPTHRVLENIEQQKAGNKSKGFRSKSKTGSDLIYKDIIDNITAQLHSHIQGAMIANAQSEMFKNIASSKDGAKIAVKISKQAYYNKIPATEQAKNILEFLRDSDMGIILEYEEEGTVTDESEDITTNEEIEAKKNDDAPIGVNIVSMKEYEEYLEEFAGMDEKELGQTVEKFAEYIMMNPSILSYFTFGNPPKKIADSQVIMVLIDNKEQYFELAGTKESNLLAETLDSLGGFQVHGVLGKAYEVGMWWKSTFTKLITSNPKFKLGNIKRDYQETLMWRDNRKGSNTLIPHSPFKAMQSFLAEDDFYHDYMLNGGGYGSFVEANTEHDYQDILLGSKSERFFRRYSADEYANRMAVAMEARKAGLSWQQSVNYGRDITLDFSMRGANRLVNLVTNLSPFLRAGLNGTYKVIREMNREGSNKKAIAFTIGKIFSRGGAYLTGLSMMAFFMGKDDDRYKKLTADEKASKLYFFYSDDAKPIIIEIPHAVGFMTQKLPEYLLDSAYGTDVPVGTTRKAVMFALKNQVFALPDGGIFQPFFDVYSNTDYTGHQIVPDYMQNREPSEQYNSYTRDFYKKVGERYDVSPVQIQHIFKSLFTYPEQILGDLSDIALWSEENGVPTKTYADVGLETLDKNINRGGYATGRSSYKDEYMDSVKEIKKTIGSFNFLKKELMYSGKAGLDRFKKFTKDMDKIAFTINDVDSSIKEQMSAYRTKQNLIKRSKEYNTSTEKRKALEAVNKDIVNLYKKYLSIVRDMREKSNKIKSEVE